MSMISGSRSLHRLIYCSRQLLRPGDEDEQLGEIIRASAQNNRDASLTGLLLLHDDYFVQALEGPAEAVLTTYGRIGDDPRHEATKVLAAGPATAREFSDWNMCARRITPADTAILDTLARRGPFNPTKLSGRAALSLLTAVRGIQARTHLAATG